MKIMRNFFNVFDVASTDFIDPVFFFFTFTVVENLPWLLYYLIVHLIESNTADLSKSINSRWRQETKLYFSICSIGVSIELITTFEWYYCCVDFQSSNSFNFQNCWTDFSLRHSFILISEQQIRTSSAATPKKEKKNAMLTSPEFVSSFFFFRIIHCYWWSSFFSSFIYFGWSGSWKHLCLDAIIRSRWPPIDTETPLKARYFPLAVKELLYSL